MLDIYNYDEVKERLEASIMSETRYREKGYDLPCMRVLDLVITFKILAAEYEDHSAMILVNDSLLNAWGKTVQDLLIQSGKNMDGDNMPVLVTMKDMMMHIFFGYPDCKDDKTDCFEKGFDFSKDIYKDNMFILTNKKCMNGAVCLFTSDLLGRLSLAMGCDIFIIPSSIHELILLPDSFCDDAGMLGDTLRTVNRELVDEDERLSDNIYMYSFKDKALKIAWM